MGNISGLDDPAFGTQALSSLKGPYSEEDYSRLAQILPKDLCGSQVLIEEEAVLLIYVSEGQINFVVPRDLKTGARVALRVTHDVVSSIPVWLKSGPDRIDPAQREAAYTGMPVWVYIYNVSGGSDPPGLPLGIRKIFSSAACPHIEVRYNGSLLPELKSKNPPRRITYSGPGCPTPQSPDRRSLAHRVPLHLQYRFERAGTYTARYAPGQGPFGTRPATAESQWVPIVVNAGGEEQRRKWLRDQANNAPSDREGLVYDFLPSIAGYGDPAVLGILLKYLYHRDTWVSSAASEYLRDYYPAGELGPALQQIEKRRGKNKNVEQLLRDLRGEPAAR